MKFRVARSLDHGDSSFTDHGNLIFESWIMKNHEIILMGSWKLTDQIHWITIFL